MDAPDFAPDASRYASRKFLLTTVTLTAATLLLLYGKIDAKVWADTSTWTLGLYMAGNVGTWFVEAFKARGT